MIRDEGSKLKMDYNLIIDSSIVRSPISDNTCMFYALYNSLRTTELRIAFSDGNGYHPSLVFTNMFNQVKYLERIQNEGYTSEDMRLYLLYLRDIGRIKRFVWAPLKKDWQLSAFFCSGDKRPVTILIFAHATVSTMRETFKKKIKSAKKSISAGGPLHSTRANLALARAHENFSDYFLKKISHDDLYSHGAVLKRHDTGEVTFYDTSRRLVKENPTIEDIGWNLVAIFKAYKFELIL